jgi:hypothetical protein
MYPAPDMTESNGVRLKNQVASMLSQVHTITVAAIQCSVPHLFSLKFCSFSCADTSFI